MSTPNDFAVFYKDWYDNTLSKDAKAKKAFDEKETLTIVLKTGSMTVKAATKDAAAKDLLDLSVVECTNKTHKLVNLVLTDEFKAETALIMYNGNNDNAYAITLPENAKAFDLEMQFANSTARVKSAGETTINFLTPKVSNNNNSKGLILGEGITIQGFIPFEGGVTLDGAVVEALAVVPGKSLAHYGSPAYDGDGNVYISQYSYYYDENEGYLNDHSPRIKDGKAMLTVSGRQYSIDKVNNVVTSSYHYCHVTDADGNEVYVNTVKVFKGDGVVSNWWNPSNVTPLEKLLIAADAHVRLTNNNVAEIEGEGSKSLLTLNGTTAGIGSIKKVTLTNQSSSYLDIKTIVEDCTIQPIANCYPEAGTIKNNTFASLVYVVPVTQSAEYPTYSQTFEGCTFSSNVRLATNFADDAYVLDEEGNPVVREIYYYQKLIPETTRIRQQKVNPEDGTPMVDENGDPVMEWVTVETGNLVWSGFIYGPNGQWTDKKSNIPAEALAMDPEGTGKYWFAETQVAIVPDNGDKTIKDYIVTIVMDNCKVKSGNSSVSVTKDSNIFDYFTPAYTQYDEDVRYTIDGVTYKAVKVWYKSPNGTFTVYTTLIKE